MERLRVQWTEFPASLAGALGQLQHAGELADVTLACEGRHILAHKLVLSACSPYFRDAFKENPCHHPIIILKDVQAQDIINLLSYMYHGEVNVDEDNLPSFIQTAELLQIKGLSTGVVLQTKKQTKPPKSNVPMSFQVWKNATQLSTVLKKSSPHCVSPSTTSILKSETHQHKRRRNSTSERITEASSPDHPKKVKPSKDKITTAMSKKNETSTPSADDSNSDTPKNDSNNVGSLPTSSEKTANPSEDTSISVKVEVKHEVEDILDLEESAIDEPIDNCEDAASLSPPPLYENSMLARSLLSGVQSLKSDASTTASPAVKSKLASQLVISNVTSCRETTTAPPTSTAKFTIATDEAVVKIERLSPKSDVMELEPEVLISEQEDSCVGNRSLSKNSAGERMSGLRGDQAAGTSSQINQNNHAAICGDCPHCGTKYSNQSALKYHVRLMHSDLTNRLCCHLCPRSFTMRDTFKEHMWASHGQRN
ncbi:uncharacterized protein LOC143912217 [Arctopsyche grandis]|uniref:uncharacterized protein LOC143912217 n=1 Tax=Arctopsyche grandis TaxID=121162 RepID=UPI00406D9E2B